MTIISCYQLLILIGFKKQSMYPLLIPLLLCNVCNRCHAIWNVENADMFNVTLFPSRHKLHTNLYIDDVTGMVAIDYAF